MIAIKIKNLKKIKRAFKMVPKNARMRYLVAIKLAAQATKSEMKSEVPKKTRNLARSIQATTSGFSAVIGPNLNDAPYAVFVHEGTKTHIIRPSSKKALFWPGAKHPVKKVNHPGIKPNKFVIRTAIKATPKVNKIFELTTKKILKEFKRDM